MRTNRKCTENCICTKRRLLIPLYCFYAGNRRQRGTSDGKNLCFMRLYKSGQCIEFFRRPCILLSTYRQKFLQWHGQRTSQFHTRKMYSFVFLHCHPPGKISKNSTFPQNSVPGWMSNVKSEKKQIACRAAWTVTGQFLPPYQRAWVNNRLSRIQPPRMRSSICVFAVISNIGGLQPFFRRAVSTSIPSRLGIMIPRMMQS